MEEKYKVQVTDLHKSYDGVHEVIKGASLDVAPSEVVCIIGPSGSGKSTFLRCINKLEDFQDGHIYLDGVDLADPKVDINKMREKIGMVFQHFNLFPNMKSWKTSPWLRSNWARKTRKRPSREALHAADGQHG